jgi:predicted nucleotidyltransferase
MNTVLPRLAADLGTTDRTLRRALRDGLLRAERATPRTVELPLEERAYLRRAWPFLSELRRVLRTEPGVSLAILFGSRARGDHRPGSDVDLLVRLRPGADARELAGRLSDKLGLRVQLVSLEDAEAVPLLLVEVVREGRVLVDRDRTWPALAARRQQIERAADRERRRIESEFEAAFR